MSAGSDVPHHFATRDPLVRVEGATCARAFRQRIDRLFDDVDVLLCPVSSLTAPPQVEEQVIIGLMKLLKAEANERDTTVKEVLSRALEAYFAERLETKALAKLAESVLHRVGRSARRADLKAARQASRSLFSAWTA